MSPPDGATNAVQPPSARPTNARTRTHPDFAKKLKHLQQSDPVNPKDLTRRLELFLAEQNASPDGIVPRRVKKPRTSTTNSQTTSVPPTPPRNILRNSFLPDPIGQNLDFQKFVDNAASNQPTTSNRPEGPVKNFAYPIPVAVLNASSARQSMDPPNDNSLFLRTSPGNIPPPPRSSRIEPLQAEVLHVHNEPVPFIGGNAEARRRPESTPYVPRTAAKQLVQTATQVGAKREAQASELFDGPLPLLTLAPLSPLQASFFNDSPIQNSVANTPMITALSPGARISVGSTSTMANYTTAPTSPVPQQMISMNTLSSSPADVTSRLEKRKSWHPRNLMASMKPRNESNDRRQTTFQTTAVMVEAARQGQAKEVKIKPRPKSTAFENLTASKSVPDLPGTTDAPPMPALAFSRDGKEQKEEVETSVKESIWNRRSRRKTIGAAEAERPKDDISPMPGMEHLRWKQLAMREKALADSKRAKEDRNTSPKPPIQQADISRLDFPTSVPAVYEPKKRVTRPLKVVPPPTSKQTARQRDPSPPTRYIPQKPIKPQERSHDPVEVRPISRGTDKSTPITRPKGEFYPERTTSRNNQSPIATISPLALSLGVLSLPKGIHLLDDTPTSANSPAGTNPFQIDQDARAVDSIYTTPALEPKLETAERPKHQRDPSKPKLLLGPFPPSRPASPSSSPPKKPLPQPPRFASLQRRAHKSQSASRDVPAEQLTPWDQPMPLDLPNPLEYTRSVSPTHEQQKPKHAREISITKISSPRVVTSPVISLPLEISSPQEIAQWEILPPREAPAPRDNMPPRGEKSPVPAQASEFRPQSRNNRKVFPSIDMTQPHLDRKRSQPILNQYGEPALRPRASSTDIRPSFLQESSKPPRLRAGPSSLRPKTSGGLRTAPVYTIEVQDHEIAEMTPASVKLLREQQSLLRRRALAAAGHSDPESALRRSPTPLSELRDRARGGTGRSPTVAASSNKAMGRSPAPLAGPGAARNPYPSPRVSLDRQGRIQTHLGGSADRRPGPPSLRAPLDSRPTTSASPKRRPIPGTGGSISLPPPIAQSSGFRQGGHSASGSVHTLGTPIVPHVSGTQMAEEMKLEREREINANRAKYGLPARSFSIPYVEEKLAGRLEGSETPDTERRRRGKDKWWKIWRVV